MNLNSKFNKAFWDWFGDSKVVDENGQPLVVYRGQKKDFGNKFKHGTRSLDFKKSTNTFGFFFTDKVSTANSYSRGTYGNIMQVYLCLKNPLDMRNLPLIPTEKQFIAFLNKIGLTNYKSQSKLNIPIPIFQFFDEYGESLRYDLQSLGYDGIIFEDVSALGTTYIAFYPNQIKSATGNDGTWDIDDDSILSGANMKKIDSKFNKAFWDWFGDSKVVDENGKPLVVYHGTVYGKFDKFKGKEIFFSESEKFAQNYAEDKSFARGLDADVIVIPAYLKIEKLFDGKNQNDINKIHDLLPDEIEVGWGNAITKSEFLRRLKGEMTLPPKWSKDKITKAKYGHAIGSARDGYNNDIFVGINSNNEVVYVSISNQEIMPYLNDNQIQDLLNGKRVTDKIYQGYYKKFRIDELKQARENGDIDQEEYFRAVKNQVRVDIQPYSTTQEETELTDVDNWQYIELNNIDLIDLIKSLGYDGLKVTERGYTNYVVFSPNQIKSVNNDGTWDIDDDSILSGANNDTKQNLLQDRLIDNTKRFYDIYEKANGKYADYFLVIENLLGLKLHYHYGDIVKVYQHNTTYHYVYLGFRKNPYNNSLKYYDHTVLSHDNSNTTTFSEKELTLVKKRNQVEELAEISYDEVNELIDKGYLENSWYYSGGGLSVIDSLHRTGSRSFDYALNSFRRALDKKFIDEYNPKWVNDLYLIQKGDLSQAILDYARINYLLNIKKISYEQSIKKVSGYLTNKTQ